MTQRPDRFTVCLMCYGADKETQERLLKERKPDPHCHLCRGTGGLEVQFKKGLDSNEIVATGKIGEAGFPIIKVSADYNK